MQSTLNFFIILFYYILWSSQENLSHTSFPKHGNWLLTSPLLVLFLYNEHVGIDYRTRGCLYSTLMNWKHKILICGGMHICTLYTYLIRNREKWGQKFVIESFRYFSKHQNPTKKLISTESIIQKCNRTKIRNFIIWKCVTNDRPPMNLKLVFYLFMIYYVIYLKFIYDEANVHRMCDDDPSNWVR